MCFDLPPLENCRLLRQQFSLGKSFPLSLKFFPDFATEIARKVMILSEIKNNLEKPAVFVFFSELENPYFSLTYLNGPHTDRVAAGVPHPVPEDHGGRGGEGQLRSYQG